MCAYLVEKQKSRQLFQTEHTKFSEIEGIESLEAFIKDSPFTPFPPSSRPGNKEVTLALQHLSKKDNLNWINVNS